MLGIDMLFVLMVSLLCLLSYCCGFSRGFRKGCLYMTQKKFQKKDNIVVLGDEDE